MIGGSLEPVTHRRQTKTLRYFTKRTVVCKFSPADTSSRESLCKKLSATYPHDLPTLR
jgi:hypothetical protein